MKRRVSLVILAAALFLGLGLLFFQRHLENIDDHAIVTRRPMGSTVEHQVGPPVAKSENEKRDGLKASNSKKESYLAAYATPIAFYGKVVDENGESIEGATIKIAVDDGSVGDSSYCYQTSDNSGRFELHGARGLSLSVWVSKNGYYVTEESRGRNFVYGGVRGGKEPLNPSPENPAVFVLKKMGATVPLVHVPLQAFRIPKDGTPVEIDLSTGQPTEFGSGHVRFEVWTENQNVDPNRSEPYSWRVRVRVVSGGLIERLGENDFTAPETGYAPIYEAEMPKTARPWRKGIQKEYFARLGNGQYARFNFELTTAGDHFIVLESFLNPQPGSRNLEFDPAKVIKPQP